MLKSRMGKAALLTVALSLGGLTATLAQESPAAPATPAAPAQAAVASGTYRFEVFTEEPSAESSALASLDVGVTAADLSALAVANAGARYLRISTAEGEGVYRILVNPYNGRVFVMTANGIRPLERFLAEAGFTVEGNMATAGGALSWVAPFGAGTAALPEAAATEATAQSAEAAAGTTGTADTAAAGTTGTADAAAAGTTGTADTAAAGTTGTADAAAAGTTGTTDTAATGTTGTEAAGTTGTTDTAAAGTTGTTDTAATTTTTTTETSTTGTTGTEAAGTTGTTDTAAAGTTGTTDTAAAGTTGTEATAPATTEAAATVTVEETALADVYSANVGDISLSVVPAARPLPAASESSLAIAPFTNAADAKYAIAGNVVTLSYTSDASLEDVVRFYRTQLEGQGFTFDENAMDNGVVSDGAAVLTMWRADRPVVLTISQDATTKLITVEADLNELVVSQ